MSRLILSKRGIGLIEVMIAIFLVAVGVMAILSMQPTAWRTIGKSDYMGRGAGILHRELELRESWIMNPCNVVPLGDRPVQAIIVSGLGAEVRGDVTYTVNTNITAVAGTINQWTVTVTVTWPDQVARNYRNLVESAVVSQQDGYKFPTGCANSSNAVPAGF
jgi:AAA+ superfamily predicted ATPase